MEKVKLSDLNLLDLGNSINLSGMILSGDKDSYIVPTPEGEVHDLKLLELDLEDWKVLLRQTDLQEVEVLMDDNSGIKKAILRKTARQIDAQVSWAVYRRDDYKCRYCGCDDKPLTVDHLILWEEGGPSIEENLVSACKKCNKKRGNMQYADWLSSDVYIDRAADLMTKVHMMNYDLIETLKDIPRKLHIPSRGKKKRK